MRNPIFRDLSTYNYPIIYSLLQESEYVQEICGDVDVAFAYYYTWWLPISSASKLFNLCELARNVLLYFWALLGMMLIIYLLNRKLGKCTWIVPIILISFSGLDALPWILRTAKLPYTSHMEWWANYFQYSSNSTQLFWVFNQSIPIWLIVSMLLQLKNNRYVASLCALAFAYSPWATFGIIPIAIGGSWRKNEKLKNVFSPVNIAIPLSVLAIYGTFYMASSGSEGGIYFIFSLYADQKRRILCNYLIFLFVEFGVYYILLGDKAKEYKYYYIVLAELMVFPLFGVRDVNFVMRGTIAPLFLLMFFIIKYLHDGWEDVTISNRKRLLIFVLCIGALTPLTEINRTLEATMSRDDIIRGEIYSFGDMPENEGYILTVKNQFFVYEYEDTLFFKYLAK